MSLNTYNSENFRCRFLQHLQCDKICKINLKKDYYFKKLVFKNLCCVVAPFIEKSSRKHHASLNELTFTYIYLSSYAYFYFKATLRKIV